MERRSRKHDNLLTEKRQALDEYFNEQVHGTTWGYGADYRRSVIDEEKDLYGDQSMIVAVQDYFLQGYPPLTEVVNRLRKSGIHNKEQLLDIDLSDKSSSTPRFQKDTIQVVLLMRDLYKTEKELGGEV